MPLFSVTIVENWNQRFIPLLKESIMNEPLVSVMMPAYNAASYIKEAVESMQEQTYKNWELCIIDDGSTDNTFDIIEELASQDSRIKFGQIDHEGCPSARNACLTLCEGLIIARLDADDLQHPERLEKQVHYLLNNEVDLVTCQFCWQLNDALVKRDAKGMNKTEYMNGQGSGPVCASIVAWRGVYDEIGLFNTSLLGGSDGEWNVRAIISGFTWGFLPEHLYYQRRHPNQISHLLRHEQHQTIIDARNKYRKIWNEIRTRTK